MLALYWARNEQAIDETDNTYGNKLRGLSYRIVSSREDSQECVNDTYLAAWKTIPPKRPEHLFAYLARICRNLSLNVLEKRNAAKRAAEVVALTAELELCIPDRNASAEPADWELSELLNAFLGTLPKDSRIIFLRRYWFADTVEEISKGFGYSQAKVKTQLHRIRNKLRNYLEERGVGI